MSKQTAVVAENMFGEKLYQQRARIALPILVLQAFTQEAIHYEDLASELGMPNARNLNYVLGSVGTTLQELELQWDEPVPPIQCLVTNKATGLPGVGFDSFLSPGSRAAKLSTREKRRLVNAASSKVFTYNKWLDVLAEFDLKPVAPSLRPEIEKAKSLQGGGEGQRHRALKEAIAGHPPLASLPSTLAQGLTEFSLPSGDSIDVLFQSKTSWIAVEVKTKDSPNADIVRGLFQCVKYLAVMEAWSGYESMHIDLRVVLALEGPLAKELIPLKNALGIEVVDSIGDSWKPAFSASDH